MVLGVKAPLNSETARFMERMATKFDFLHPDRWACVEGGVAVVVVVVEGRGGTCSMGPRCMQYQPAPATAAAYLLLMNKLLGILS